ncbi:MAG: acyl-CoA dehydratase activase [Deltaproteobacteria bacterium]|nr:acyl-CoA dehydratase activase [Deltaproteobacteria bacterium]
MYYGSCLVGKGQGFVVHSPHPDYLPKLKGLGEGVWGRGQGPSAPDLRPHISAFSAAGLDFGSRFVKMVYGSGKGALVRRKLDSLDFYRDYLVRGNDSLDIDWQRLGLVRPHALVVTGYGKNLLKEHFPTITEIRASFLGAKHQTGLEHFIILEMGGQDTKVLYVKSGKVFDFLTNDRCAAGTGRYLENMARFLKMPLGRFAGCWQDQVEISQTCAIFGESELIGFLLEGVPIASIAAGVNASVARRALALVRRYKCSTLVFTGGVAQNRAIVRMLEAEAGLKVLVPPYPQFTGALGCYLEAGARQPRLGHD